MPGIGVSSPMLHIGSCASRAMVLRSSRARSASSPAIHRPASEVRVVGAMTGSDTGPVWASGGVTTWRRLSARTVDRAASSRAWRSWRMTCRSTSTTRISPGPRRRRSIDLGSLDGHRAAFRGGGHETRRRDRHRQRPQAVAVEHRAHPDAVAECEGRRAVPGRHQTGRASAERIQLGYRLGAQACRVRDGDQQGRVQTPARRDHQLECLVQGQGIRGALVEQRTEGREPVADAATELGAPATDLLPVAAHGVDLAVVGEHPEWLRQRPRGVGIGGVALMEHDVADRHGGQQVGVQGTQALTGDEALVHDRPGRCGCDGELIQAGGSTRDLGASAGEQQALLQVGPGGAGGCRDHGLLHGRQGRPSVTTQGIGIDRHAPPALHPETLGLHGPGQQTSGRVGGRGIPGQEQHEHARIARHARRDERAARMPRAAAAPRRHRWTLHRRRTRRGGRGPRGLRGRAATPGPVPTPTSPPRTRRHRRRARIAGRRAGRRDRTAFGAPREGTATQRLPDAPGHRMVIDGPAP